MAAFPKNNVILAHSLLVFAVFLNGALACSPPIGGYRPPTLEYKMMDSDVVASGTPILRMDDPKFPGDKVWSVDFEIRCIFKGAPLDEVIRIDEVGEIPGLCISTNLTEGKNYLVYLRPTEKYGRYTQVYRHDPGDEQYLDEVTFLCEATVSYPNGITADNAKESCPEEYDYDDCVPRPEITTMDPKVPPPPPEDMDTAGNPPPPPGDDVPSPPPPADDAGTGNDQKAPYQPVVDDSEKNPDDSSSSLTYSLVCILCVLLASLVL